DDALVRAIGHRLGDRKALRIERRDRAELAVDRMRGWQQLAGRLAAEHVASRRRCQQIGRVRLAALELAYRQRALKATHMLRQIGFEPRRIKAQRLGDLLGSTEGDLALDLGHCLLSEEPEQASG